MILWSVLQSMGWIFYHIRLEEYVNTFIAEQSQENAYVASKGSRVDS